VGAPLERVAHDPLDPVAGVDRLLDGDLVRRALPVEAAGAAVQPLGVLPHDDEVHILLRVRRHERLHARIADHRRRFTYWSSSKRIRRSRSRSRMPGRHAGPHRAEQDRVAPREPLELVVGQDLAGPQVPVGAEVELRPLDVEALRGRPPRP
jgi:hypothetical protein